MGLSLGVQMGYSVTLPVGMELQDWANQVCLDLSASGAVINILVDGKQWQKWALSFMNQPDISRFNPPNPLEFQDWVDWANRFVQTVS